MSDQHYPDKSLYISSSWGRDALVMPRDGCKAVEECIQA